MARTKQTSKQSETAPAVETPVVAAAPVVVAPVVQQSAPAVVEPVVEQKETDEILDRISQLTAALSALKKDYISKQKKFSQEMRAMQKASGLNKKRRRTGTNSKGGFTQPTKIVTALATFMGLSDGAEVPRSSVTKFISQYARDNKLHGTKLDKEGKQTVDKRSIVPDKKLAALLGDLKGVPLTYFNLQRYIKHLFVPTVKAAVATA